ncbi:MAG: hypothetical protein J6Y29_03775 [Clostridiales bacterium]|nr:hypothetical protein [Clostridiales bacterium]
MIYTGDLVTINNQSFDNLVTYKIGRSKLWKNADRNMNGDVRATLIGIFPKIKMKINYTTQQQMADLTQILDQDFFTVTWFDVRIQATVSTQYYASDYDIELDNKAKGRYKPFEVNLVPVSKRRY